jgi:pimeloyl-ACP methyl ester carboxylesterase
VTPVGLALHHTLAGHEGPPVLLLHGLGSSSADWAWQTAALRERYRVVAVDLPGHGRSPVPGAPLTVEAMADAVTGVLTAATGTPAHVVGLSLGACVALRMTLQAPGCVRSLTLVNPFARVRPQGPGDVVRMLTRLALLAGAPMPRLAAHVAGRLFPWPEQGPLYEAAVASLAATPRRGYAAAVRALARFDARGQLAAVRRPTLVVAGDRDLVIPLGPKLALAAGIPGARVEVVPGSGHVTPVDRPDAFNRLLLEFLAGH